MTDPETFEARAREAGVHTVELGTPDSQGHLRGKRIPIDRFFETTVASGANIADAMFVFDMQNDLPENEFINMDSGYLDCRLVPDLSTGRILTHRPGYALVFGSVEDPHGAPLEFAPRNVLARQVERCGGLGLHPVVATELECYLCTPDWEPVQEHIQYSSLTDALGVETVLADIRAALAGAGIEVESSNAEYGPGQVEVNTGPADAMTSADNTVLYKSIIKQVAVAHGMRATFMPKPWADQSGSGMHIHTSLQDAAGVNAFADSEGTPNELMSRWLAGQLAHAHALMLFAAPTVNGPKRLQPYTFAPTHVHWGLDNRTVLARCIVEGSPANRIEFRSAGADANPHLMIAGVLAAGADGVERELVPPPMMAGDCYTNPGDAEPLSTSLAANIEAFLGSELADMLGERFSRSYASIAAAEADLGAEHAPDPEDVNNWERARYMEHC